jgi:hypothetical protein
MKIQTFQSYTPVRLIGSPSQCNDCEEENRLEDAIQQDLNEDRVSLSQTSLSLASNELKTGAPKEGEEEPATEATGPKTELKLSDEERRVLTELRSRDAQVRAHEQAHLSAAGPYANGAPTFEYQTGPDGKQYAVGGEVSIDTSPVPGDPEATARKAQAVKRAALAPRDPSAQDRKVAGQAAKLEAQARHEAQAEKAEEKKELSESDKTPSSTEENDPSTANPENNKQSEQQASNPFAQRVAKQFNPSSIASGNLLDTIS